MIITWANDGQNCERPKIEAMGFRLDGSRDFKSGGEKRASDGEDESLTYDFVGFVTNENDDLMVVFPKHFAVKQADADAELLFRVINRHRQKRPDCYLGERYGEDFRSNYPFAAFFGIYDYYRRFGLYVEEQQTVRPGIGGRVNWKETIRRADLFVSGGKVILHPLYYRQKYRFSTFLTECMVFAIDYTLGKFESILGLPATGRAFPETDYLRERETVVEMLRRLREQVFRDELLSLIDHLIAFYSMVREGGSYYWKYYHFEYVWEDMVLEYLKGNFCGMGQEGLVFDRDKAAGLPFQKTKFYPNRANPEQYIELDAYAAVEETQYIFDAKYYTRMKELDYKQVAYHMFLCKMRKQVEAVWPMYRITHTALLLPGEKRGSRLHFEMDPLFSREYADVKIWETYLDVREVMEGYGESVASGSYC
ncbi:MAG: LlaJI family restriction endonuclease [Candidatus Gastranaerophilales bacterium]|nr:LlaJI family restriction endonuclease [Candidatus Gastranaerophilales bacterium]